MNLRIVLAPINGIGGTKGMTTQSPASNRRFQTQSIRSTQSIRYSNSGPDFSVPLENPMTLHNPLFARKDSYAYNSTCDYSSTRNNSNNQTRHRLNLLRNSTPSYSTPPSQQQSSAGQMKNKTPKPAIQYSLHNTTAHQNSKYQTTKNQHSTNRIQNACGTSSWYSS